MKKQECKEKKNKPLGKRKETSGLRKLESGETKCRNTTMLVKKNLNSMNSKKNSRKPCLKVPAKNSKPNMKQMCNKPRMKSDGFNKELVMKKEHSMRLKLHLTTRSPMMQVSDPNKNSKLQTLH